MNQFCEHGREVYCPLCEDDALDWACPPSEPPPEPDFLDENGVVILPFNTIFAEYRNFVRVGADKKVDSFFKSKCEHHKALGAIGLASESGEVLDLFKKQFFHSKTPTDYRDKVVKELGDVLWYFVLKASAEGITMDEIVYENMKKLVLRYPERHPELVAKFKD